MDYIEVQGQRWLIQNAVCCRSWPVIFGINIGSCGYCGRRPVIQYDESE